MFAGICVYIYSRCDRCRRGCRIPWNWVFFMCSRFLTTQSSARANCTHTLVIQQHSCYFHRFGFCFEQRPWYVVQVNLKHHLTGLKFTVISTPHLPRTEISDMPITPCLFIYLASFVCFQIGFYFLSETGLRTPSSP